MKLSRFDSSGRMAIRSRRGIWNELGISSPRRRLNSALPPDDASRTTACDEVSGPARKFFAPAVDSTAISGGFVTISPLMTLFIQECSLCCSHARMLSSFHALRASSLALGIEQDGDRTPGLPPVDEAEDRPTPPTPIIDRSSRNGLRQRSSRTLAWTSRPTTEHARYLYKNSCCVVRSRRCHGWRGPIMRPVRFRSLPIQRIASDCPNLLKAGCFAQLTVVGEKAILNGIVRDPPEPVLPSGEAP